ncbi:hypothetical protein CORC01_14501 [Colletotrichum orchidophilum]|uniref:Uncharacterized protein n=1 Tax=Colletotrichum orchidophilum TaxID=1209926 RepID=A0A1G4AM68_9PEZI|nr:uncharacterized protein CORC01_14501 [Colletotrichum orchidophilum]OHE90206.1 hypothetical protein CORC01_14501 [Colletotrichum orchidophilum]
MAARAQSPLRQTSRRVCGVEGRKPPLSTLPYIVLFSRPLSLAIWLLCVLFIFNSR